MSRIKVLIASILLYLLGTLTVVLAAWITRPVFDPLTAFVTLALIPHSVIIYLVLSLIAVFLPTKKRIPLGLALVLGILVPLTQYIA